MRDSDVDALFDCDIEGDAERESVLVLVGLSSREKAGLLVVD